MPRPSLDLRTVQRAIQAVAWTPVQHPTPAHGTSSEVYATHEGVLELPGVGAIPCYLLNTGEPVFDVETLTRLLEEGDDLPQ